MASRTRGTLIDSVAALERETGVPRATLRIWERRYGFPQPQRDHRGHRVYDRTQVAKLRLIAQLLARGRRPGELLTRSVRELREQLADAGTGADHPIVSLVRNLDTSALSSHLLQALASGGVHDFICDKLASANAAVGQAWAWGELQPYEEHAYTECVQQVLRAALAGIVPVPPRSKPRIVLATLPAERHGLALLMVQVLAAESRCACLSLGLELPPSQIAEAAADWQADCVALSISGSADVRHVLAELQELRALLDPAVALWLGGASRALQHEKVAGLANARVFASIGELPAAIASLRAAAA